MLATLTRPVTTTWLVAAALGARGARARREPPVGTRPASRAASASSSIVGISSSVLAAAAAAASASAAPRSGPSPSAARRGSSASAGGDSGCRRLRGRLGLVRLGRLVVGGLDRGHRGLDRGGVVLDGVFVCLGAALRWQPPRRRRRCSPRPRRSAAAVTASAASARRSAPPPRRPAGRRCRLGGGDAWPRSVVVLVEPVERRRLGQVLGHRRELGRVVLGHAAARRSGPSRPRTRSTRAWTRSIRCSIRAACSSSSTSRSALRWVIRRSVSSRMRASSAFDQSRISTMSSSALLRSSVASSAVRAWIPSMCSFASAWNCSIVAARDASAAACIARVRSARNLVGFFGAGPPAGAPERGRRSDARGRSS